MLSNSNRTSTNEKALSIWLIARFISFDRYCKYAVRRAIKMTLCTQIFIPSNLVIKTDLNQHSIGFDLLFRIRMKEKTIDIG